MTIKSNARNGIIYNNWDNYFIGIAKLVASRSKCLKMQVGCVLVQDKRIIATGYNGPPSGISECTVCERLESGKDLHLCRGVHAELNAIIQCARYGSSSIGSILYCTHQPCMTCCKAMINAGISSVYYNIEHPYDNGLSLLQEANIPYYMVT